MRKAPAINVLFPRARTAILACTLMQPQQWWYLSDLARHLGLRPSSLQRELSSLVAAGILRRKRDGNRVYFQPDPECPLFPELRGLMMKTAGLFDVIRHALGPFAGSIRWAFVYGSVARSEERSSSDVDLMVMGKSDWPISPRLSARQKLAWHAPSTRAFTRPKNLFEN